MKRFLPHLCLAMAISMAIITYLDDRNPMMGFLRSTTGRIYCYLFSAIVLVTAIVLIADRRRKDHRLYREHLRIEESKKEIKEIHQK